MRLIIKEPSDFKIRMALLGYSQLELAKKAGISNTTLSGIVSKEHSVYPKNAIKLAHVLNANVSDVFNGYENGKTYDLSEYGLIDSMNTKGEKENAKSRS